MKYINSFEKFGDWFKKNKEIELNTVNDSDGSDHIIFPNGQYCTVESIPEIGCYVILNIKYNPLDGYSHPNEFENVIGTVTRRIAWNPEHTGVLVTIRYKINNKAGVESVVFEDAYSHELECWSKNKNEIDSYLDSKKYNI